MKMETLKPNQQKAILFLLECNTVSEAAKKSKISESCIWEWMKDETFAAALNQQREAMFQEAMLRLKTSSLKATDALLSLLDSKDERIRRGTANDILDKALKYTEILDLVHRINLLEEAVKKHEIR